MGLLDEEGSGSSGASAALGAVDCGALSHHQCQCLAANVGLACRHCPSSGQCLDAASAAEACVDSARAQRRAAEGCASADTNLVRAPLRAVASPSVLPWEGDRLTEDFGALFLVEWIHVDLEEGSAPVRLDLWPVAHDNLAALAEPCATSPCSWELPVPVVRNISLTSATGEPLRLSGLDVQLVDFHPVDGELGYSGEWSACSNLCGNGTQTRQRLCNSPLPAYGGLQCASPEGDIVVSDEIVRTCQSNVGCGTDWRVVLIVGWWQLLVVVVFLSRKFFAFIVGRVQAKREMERVRRRRFSSDFDAAEEGVAPAHLDDDQDDHLDLDERLLRPVDALNLT